MKKIYTFFCLLLMLCCTSAFAGTGVWEHKWDKSKSSGGEGFYHMTDDDALTQETKLNGLNWTYTTDNSVIAYTASSGQMFGTTKSPVTHCTLSTDELKGRITSISVDAKAKADDQVVSISAKVNGVSYVISDDKTNSLLTSTISTYKFTPSKGLAEEGKIEILVDQSGESKGSFYFTSIKIEYSDGTVEKADAELDFAQKEVTVEVGDISPANALTNPHELSPIKYVSSDEEIGKALSDGRVYAMGKLGETTISAIYGGNECYKADTASYTLKVIAKPVIAAPTVNVPGGTYYEPITVTIKSDDEKCKSIWYSTSAKDSLDFVNISKSVEGNEVTITIDKSCTLYCSAVDGSNIGNLLKVDYVIDIELSAEFSAEENKVAYYKMGWDSVEEASTWKYYGMNENNTWTLTEESVIGYANVFETIDPNSKYSLSIYYDSKNSQKERAVSPEIEILPNSEVQFYALFNGIWVVYADWKLKIKDLTTGTEDLLVSGFAWSQDTGFEGPNWVKFDFDLSKYSGHKCTFEFSYEGMGGESMSIDGFKICQSSDDSNAKINITTGDCVHFTDKSVGNPDSWEWIFTGADVETSTEQNPVVTYSNAGEYDVTLKIKRGEDDSYITKKKIVIVKEIAPIAHIGSIASAYKSPWALAAIPANVPVTFADASTGKPTEFKWTFTGADVETSTEQNPTVTYKNDGTYGVTLEVSNSAGSSKDFVLEAIQVGGTQDIWNISPDESSSIAGVPLGFYGKYAGSNYLGMRTFAEHFDKPLATATISKATVYFDTTVAENQDALITVSICLPNKDGMPGEAIVSKSLKVSELKYDSKNVVGTNFIFDETVDVNTEFFITIGGFPTEGQSDDVSVLCARREVGELCTAYAEIQDEDENYQPLDSYTWYKNVDDPLSMAMTATIKYNNETTAILAPNAYTFGSKDIYTINGTKVSVINKPGTYIIREGNDVRKVIVK